MDQIDGKFLMKKDMMNQNQYFFHHLMKSVEP